MSSIESEVRKNVKRKLAELKKTDQSTPNLAALCDASVRIAKTLLGLGAENNWDDVVESKGRSMEAGKYRAGWLYLSRKDHNIQDGVVETPKSGWFKTFKKQGIPQTFFYNMPRSESRTNKNYVARNAACAVLSLTGSCDQHAFVEATILRAILPIGTPISICGMRLAGRNFPHTFVIVGDLKSNRHEIPLTELDTTKLLAVDAWPTQGGAVVLKDFFVCEGLINRATLIVDQRYEADGKDHLVKRIAKQKILLDILDSQFSEESEEPMINAEPGGSLTFYTHHDLSEQMTYTKRIMRDRYLTKSPSDYGEDMFGAPTISKNYSRPTGSEDAYNYIFENYPHKQFKRCIEYVEEKIQEIISFDRKSDEDFKARLNSGPYG